MPLPLETRAHSARRPTFPDETQGLAFGARLKVLRSLSQDSTTPSAKRRLRLAAEAPHSPSIYVEEDHVDGEGGIAHSHAFERVDASPPPEKPKRRSFLPFSTGGGSGSKASAKRSASRNGPNGIVISGPMMAQKAGGGVSVLPPVYQLGR